MIRIESEPKLDRIVKFEFLALASGFGARRAPFFETETELQIWAGFEPGFGPDLSPDWAVKLVDFVL